MSLFRKILLLLVIIGGLNWGIYGIWGFDAVGWLLGGSLGWLARAVFIVVGLAAIALIPSLFMSGPRENREPITPQRGGTPAGSARPAPNAENAQGRFGHAAQAAIPQHPWRSRQKSPAPTQPAGRHARGAQQRKPACGSYSAAGGLLLLERRFGR